jgi:hypothetical protein
MAYFDTKKGSLEEAIKAAVSGQINEKVEYVEYKFKNKNDAMKAKSMLDGIQLMSFDINDDDINNGELAVDAGSKDMAKYHKEVMKKFKPVIMSTETNKNDKSDDGEGMDAVQPKAVKKKFADRKDKDIDNDGDVDSSDKYLHKRRKAVSKAIKSEDLSKDDEKSVGKVIKGLKKAVKIHQGQVDSLDKDIKDSFEYGTKEATENSLNMTPGQSTQDWDEQVGIMHKKQNTMRETVAKMWGVEEGHNPFRNEEKVPKGYHRMPDGSLMKDSDMPKKEDKTMTGKPMTKVSVNSDEKKD